MHGKRPSADDIQEMEPGMRMDNLIGYAIGKMGLFDYSTNNRYAVDLLDWLKKEGIEYHIYSTHDDRILVELSWIQQTPPIKWVVVCSKGVGFCDALCRAVLLAKGKRGWNNPKPETVVNQGGNNG